MTATFCQLCPRSQPPNGMRHQVNFAPPYEHPYTVWLCDWHTRLFSHYWMAQPASSRTPAQLKRYTEYEEYRNRLQEYYNANSES